MKKVEELDLNDFKSQTDEKTAGFMDEQAEKMLALVKQYETEENFWFVKYYIAQAFSIFITGAMAVQVGEDIWFNPDEGFTEDMKRKTVGFIKDMYNKDLTSLFEGREDLMFHLFAYGTHQANLERLEDLEKERQKEIERADWGYLISCMYDKGVSGTYGGMYFATSRKSAEEWFEKKDKEGGTSLVMFRISPYLKGLIDGIERAEDALCAIASNEGHFEILRVNEKAENMARS